MFCFRRSESQSIRRSVALLTLLAFVIAAAPIPIPVTPIALSAAGVDEPFPCQGSRCGCRSAKQCWTACCCRKPSERKRWAEERNVQPPAYAILQDAVSSGGDERPAAATSRSCCSTSAAVAKPACPPEPRSTSCCVSTSTDEVAESSGESSDGDYVLMIRAMECRGHAHDISSIAWFHWSPAVPAAHDRLFETLAQRHYDDRADSFLIDPATPPPRLG
jgi:hypothetical protein